MIDLLHAVDERARSTARSSATLAKATSVIKSPVPMKSEAHAEKPRWTRRFERRRALTAYTEIIMAKIIPIPKMAITKESTPSTSQTQRPAERAEMSVPAPRSLPEKDRA